MSIATCCSAGVFTPPYAAWRIAAPPASESHGSNALETDIPSAHKFREFICINPISTECPHNIQCCASKRAISRFDGKSVTPVVLSCSAIGLNPLSVSATAAKLDIGTDGAHLVARASKSYADNDAALASSQVPKSKIKLTETSDLPFAFEIRAFDDKCRRHKTEPHTTACQHSDMQRPPLLYDKTFLGPLPYTSLPLPSLRLVSLSRFRQISDFYALTIPLLF